MGRLESDPSRIVGLFRHQIRQGCRIELETVQARNQQASKESARLYDLIFWKTYKLQDLNRFRVLHRPTTNYWTGTCPSTCHEFPTTQTRNPAPKAFQLRSSNHQVIKSKRTFVLHQANMRGERQDQAAAIYLGLPGPELLAPCQKATPSHIDIQV